MADHHVSEAGHPAMDYAEHERTYALFIKLFKYGTVAVVVFVVLLAYLTL